MCIDIVEIWFGIVNGQISSHFYGVICPRHDNGGWVFYNLRVLFFVNVFTLNITIFEKGNNLEAFENTTEPKILRCTSISGPDLLLLAHKASLVTPNNLKIPQWDH